MASTPSLNFIRSEGDLEVATILEIQTALDEIIGPNLYTVVRSAPHQHIRFNSKATFNLFVVLASEIFVESARIPGLKTVSLFNSLETFIKNHPDESGLTGLKQSYEALNGWLNKDVDFKFWCASLEKQLNFIVCNRRLLKLASNLIKHNILRLNTTIRELVSLYQKAGIEMSDIDVVNSLGEFEGKLRPFVKCISSHLVEMLGRVFLAINEIIIRRFEEQPINDGRIIYVPESITNDVIKYMYIETLALRKRDAKQIKDYFPDTSNDFETSYFVVGDGIY